jgi:transcriptional regulator with GAF, ATPase, and Fis domain
LVAGRFVTQQNGPVHNGSASRRFTVSTTSDGVVTRAGSDGAPLDAQRLSSITEALSAATGFDDIATSLLERGMVATGAFAGAVVILNEDGTALDLAATIGYEEEQLAGWTHFPLEERTPVSDAIRENRPVVLTSTSALLERYPNLHAFAELPHALVAFPVATADRILGAVALRFEVSSNGDGGDASRQAPPVTEIISTLREQVEQLQTALDSRVIVEQAKGVLAERHGEPVDVAFERLRRAARSRSTRIHDVAKAVVDGEEQI